MHPIKCLDYAEAALADSVMNAWLMAEGFSKTTEMLRPEIWQ
jgi:hypothetical protein